MSDNIKHETLMSVLNRIDRAVKASALHQPEDFCPHCSRYRFDPMLDRKEAWAYTSFKPGTLAVWDSKKTYDLEPIKFKNVVRYRLSSLNKLGDARMKP